MAERSSEPNDATGGPAVAAKDLSWRRFVVPGAAVIVAGAVGVVFGQAAVQNRAAGNYTLLAGKANGASAKTIYILDSANKEMVAVKWNQSAVKLDGIGYRNLAQDADAQGRSR